MNKLDGDAIAYVVGNGKRTGFEYLYVYDAKTGKVLAMHTDNLSGGVSMPGNIKQAALDRGREIVVHHNHPNSYPPSAADIDAIEKYPGILSAVISGHDGSIYRISAIQRGNIAKAIAATASTRRLFATETIAKITDEDRKRIVSIAVLSALDDVGIISSEIGANVQIFSAYIEALSVKFYADINNSLKRK